MAQLLDDYVITWLFGLDLVRRDEPQGSVVSFHFRLLFLAFLFSIILVYSQYVIEILVMQCPPLFDTRTKKLTALAAAVLTKICHPLISGYECLGTLFNICLKPKNLKTTTSKTEIDDPHSLRSTHSGRSRRLSGTNSFHDTTEYPRPPVLQPAPSQTTRVNTSAARKPHKIRLRQTLCSTANVNQSSKHQSVSPSELHSVSLVSAEEAATDLLIGDLKSIRKKYNR
ncbi:uncharacterized protein LOC131927567 [Physella acuta]|uniref:uncharacterized protein LOC131927567 n=1 Tax=Physella acuta TaxID=109671 RepID=UPI0027DDAFB9|nr:uncharacterized protein LOC131927567 [Physella acuta]